MDLRYPIGPMVLENNPTPEMVQAWIADVEAAPAALRAAVGDLAAEQLDTRYRPGGWTVRQLVHHLPDSHMNAYVRFKLALTEDTPTIKPYEEARWAELADSFDTPVEASLTLLEVLHQRWVVLLKSLAAIDFDRAYFHPALDQKVALKTALGMYAWHGRHHVAHVTTLRERMEW